MVVPIWDFLFKDITIKPALAYNDQDFSEVMEMLSEGIISLVQGYLGLHVFANAFQASSTDMKS